MCRAFSYVCQYVMSLKSSDSSVTTVSRLWTAEPRNRSSITKRGKRHSSCLVGVQLPSCSRRRGRDNCLRTERPGCQTDRSPESNSKRNTIGLKPRCTLRGQAATSENCVFTIRMSQPADINRYVLCHLIYVGCVRMENIDRAQIWERPKIKCIIRTVTAMIS